MVERERLRIARNIHDDLGARLTHIWLVSGRAEVEDLSPEELRQGFQKISGLTSDLVNSLYETVWSVNPENDHLDSLLNHLTQMARNMCEPASISCRVHVPVMIQNHPIPSGARHAVSLTVKEALHNAIKHSGASEISATFVVKAPVLRIEIADNGRGFVVGELDRGHGLRNMQNRMIELGGTARFESVPGQSTTVILEAPILQAAP
jgi:signal transduction histidine kinase